MLQESAVRCNTVAPHELERELEASVLEREAEVADGIEAQQTIGALTAQLGALERELADAHLRLTRQVSACSFRE
jgi:hypothetical protein